MIFWSLVFNILLISPLNIQTSTDTLFISPLRIPLALSSDFGELRPDHYHSGIDIKTQGVTGKAVIAPADGYVFWIIVSPGGYGKALNIRHPSGYSTVYGHLEKFCPAIDRYVKNQQYARKSFAVMLYPPQSLFRFRKGDTIAYTGNSGASSGPHLHFEIRRTENENPVNPLLFNIGPGDKIEPVIERVAVYPQGKNTLINNEPGIKKIQVTGSNGNYGIEGDEIRISGPAGFGIKAYDLLNDSYNKCAPYSYELLVDNSIRFRYIMNEFSFAESRYVNSHLDYETYMKENTYYERLFILPNDRLSVYHNAVDRGIFNFNDGKIHHVQIIAKDAHGNKSSLDFNVRSVAPDSMTSQKKENDSRIVMPYNRTNRFRAENISVTIPQGALYDTLLFSYKKNTGTPEMYSDVHYINSKYTPVHKAYTISIKPSNIPEGKDSKMLIIQMSDDFRKSPLMSRFTDGFLTADALSFGMFYVGIDTIPPFISANGLKEGADLSGKSELRFRIRDDLSGIKNYEAFIDGNWALFEYDQKYDLLTYRFDPEKIKKGTRHNLVLRVTDNRDNMSTFDTAFIW